MFFMTYARSRPSDIVPYAERNRIGLMSNAAHRWSETSESFLPMWKYDTPHLIDSGGYNVQHNFGGYPWSVRQYHEWLSNHSDEFRWAVVMDYACEKRFDELHSVDERVEKTIENTVEHFNSDPSYRVLPVLQGRSVDDYVDCYDRLVDRGIPVDHVGLGTVCRISSTQEIVETEQAVRDRCRQVEDIHGFGVKIQAFKMGATFETADSQAWVYAASNGRMYTDEWDRLGQEDEPNDSRKRTVESFKNYHRYASRLKQSVDGGGQLRLPVDNGSIGGAHV